MGIVQHKNYTRKMDSMGLGSENQQGPQPVADVKKARDNYMVEMRKQQRNDIINKRRWKPMDDKGQVLDEPKIDLDHFNTVEWGPEIKPKVLEYLSMSVSPHQMGEYIQALTDIDRLRRHWGIIGLRKILSIQIHTPIQDIIDQNIVPLLIKYMQTESEPHMQIEATWCITNMASGTSEQTASLVDKGVIPILVQLLNTKHVTLVEQAIWGIGNIAGDCVSFRDNLLKVGALERLCEHYNLIYQNEDPKSKAIAKQIIWSISNLCRSKPPPDHRLAKPAIPILCMALQIEKDLSVMADIIWALVQLTNKFSVKTIIQSGAVPCLVQLLKATQIVIINPVLRILGNITHGEDTDTQIVLDAGVLDHLQSLMSHTHKIIRMETCWILSNVTAGTSTQIAHVLENKFIMEKLVVLSTQDHADVQREAVWAICNTTKKATPQQITF